MSLFDFFRKKKEAKIDPPEERVMKPICDVNNIVGQDETVLAQSEIPAFCTMGNLTYEKKYREAIEYGLELLKQTPHDCDVHVNLMDAYFRARKEDPTYLDKSTHHARLAILYGHHTGYCEDRLAKNLDKSKMYHQSLQLYDLILREDFHFSKHGGGRKEVFAARKDKIIAKLNQAKDSSNDVLFTKEEIAYIIRGIKDEDRRLEQERENWENWMNDLTDAMLYGSDDDFQRVFSNKP